MERFLAVNRQEKTIIMGAWEDVCDLDKRTWAVGLFDKDEPVEPKPIAVIEIVEQRFECPIDKEIYTHHDLVGVYV
jgi:hypothetical protein